jgi:hypothetical protein
MLVKTPLHLIRDWDRLIAENENGNSKILNQAPVNDIKSYIMLDHFTIYTGQ